MTLLITRTLTSTRVETVTETLLRPTSVISTITSTVLQSVTHVPAYESGSDNESIFVVMSDQKPPAHGAEEVKDEILIFHNNSYQRNVNRSVSILSTKFLIVYLLYFIYLFIYLFIKH